MIWVLAAAAALVVVAVVAAFVVRRRKPERRALTARRILVPFTGGDLDPTVLAAAIRIAAAEEATLVPAYMIVTPLEFDIDAPMQQQVARAMPLLEAVEHAALRAHVPVDARVETGRSPTHALQRLWEAERFDRIIAPAPVGRAPGFTPKELLWILMHAPSETVILRPDPQAAEPARPRRVRRASSARRAAEARPGRVAA